VYSLPSSSLVRLSKLSVVGEYTRKQWILPSTSLTKVTGCVFNFISAMFLDHELLAGPFVRRRQSQSTKYIFTRRRRSCTFAQIQMGRVGGIFSSLFIINYIFISGRIIMEADTPPVVIPMWLTGFDQLMPEGRPFPHKYLPRIGIKLSVTFGEPVPPEELREALVVKNSDGDPTAIADHDGLRGWMGDAARRTGNDTIDASKGRYYEPVYTTLIRQKITSILHRDVEALGRSISGNGLDGVSLKS